MLEFMKAQDQASDEEEKKEEVKDGPSIQE